MKNNKSLYIKYIIDNIHTAFRHSFVKPPIVIGGAAMQYYGFRASGGDVDILVSNYDYFKIVEEGHEIQRYSMDEGCKTEQFDVWHTIRGFDYKFYKEHAINEGEVLVMSIEKLMFLKAMAIDEEKSLNDIRIITKQIILKNYKQFLKNARKENGM